MIGRLRSRCSTAVLALAGAAGLGVIALAVLWLWIALSPRPPLLDGVAFSPVAVDRHGDLLRIGLATDGGYRVRTRLADVPPGVIRAVLRYEDRFFYSHPGVNPLSLIRAMGHMLLGGRRMGGSTLTMQVVRLRQRLDTSRPAGKIAQILAALRLEHHYDKDAILEAYCNLAPYGGNVEGLEAAARIWFHKPVRRLNAAEGIALAVVPQHPARRHPLHGPDFDAARARLAALLPPEDGGSAGTGGHGTSGQGATGQEAGAPRLRLFAPADLPFEAPHATTEAFRAARQGGVIHLTIDLSLQRLVERLIRQFAARGRLYGLDNAAALLVHWPSMEIRALVGSADFGDAAIQGQVDGTRARRSPGSTLKPFIYALALEQGLIHPLSLLADTPRSFGGYDPENFDGAFRGPLSAVEALRASRNVPAVALASRLHEPGLYGFLQRAGAGLPFSEEHYGLSLVLGGAELSMRDLARFYAMLANQGILRDVRLIVESDAPGAFRADGASAHPGPNPAPCPVPRPSPRRMLAPEAAFMTLHMLEDGAGQGSGPNLPLRLKTGTSNGFRDAWTVGVFGPYVLAVWVGHFDNRANPLLAGRTAALPLFRDIAAAVCSMPPATEADRPRDLVREQARGLNLKRLTVCAATGDVDISLCRDTAETWFWPGVSPIRPSGVFRTILVDRVSGLRACSPLPGRTEEIPWEFWPTDLERLFRRAGVIKPAPPPYDLDGPTCTERAPAAVAPAPPDPAGPAGSVGPIRPPDLRADRDSAPHAAAPTAPAGRPPRIVTPKGGVAYQIRLSAPEQSVIPLVAAADPDAEEIFWFAGTRFLGTSAPGASLAWTPTAGVTEIRAVDALGRAATRRVRVESVP